MNKVYKTVLNRSTGQCIVASELAKGKVKSSNLATAENRQIIKKSNAKIKPLSLLSAALFLGLGIVPNTFAAETVLYKDGQTTPVDVVVADGTIYNGNVNFYLWQIVGEYATVNGSDNITLNMTLPTTTTGVYGRLGSEINVGDNFTINNNNSNPSSSSAILYSTLIMNNSTLNIGDNAKILSSAGVNSMALVAQSGGVINVGKNATIEGNRAAITAQGDRTTANTAISTIIVDEGALITGRVASQYNSFVSVTGASISRDADMATNNDLVSLGGQGAFLSLKDVDLRVNVPVARDDQGVTQSVFSVGGISEGEISSASSIDNNYTQMMTVENARIRIGNDDGTDAGLGYGDLIQANLSVNNENLHYPAAEGNSYIYLKNVTYEANGGRLISLVDTNTDKRTTLASNKVTLVLDNVNGKGLDEGIYIGGTETPDFTGDISIELKDTTVDGGVTNNANSDLSLNVGSGSTVNGDIVNNDTGNLTSNVSNGGKVNGDVINNGSGDLDFNINDGGTLNGDAIKNGDGDLTVNVNEGGSWIGTGKGIGLWVKTNSTYQTVNNSATFTWIKSDHNATFDFGSPIASRSSRTSVPTSFKTLHSASDMTQTAGVGNIKMSTNLGLGKGDLVAIDGKLSGTYLVNITNYGGEPVSANESLRIIYSGDGSTSNVTLTGNQYRDAGMYRYHLEKDASGNSYWLVNGDGSGASHGGGDDNTSNSGNAYNPDGSFDKFVPDANFVPKLTEMSDLAYTLQGSASAQTIVMLNQSANVTKHMNEVRLTGKHDSGIWLNNYYTNTRVDKEVMGSKYTINTNTTYLGADKVWKLENGSTVITGVFAGTGFSDSKYKRNGSKGDTDVYTGGVYGMWLHDSGLFADMTAQGYRVKTSDDAYTAEGAHTNYDVKSNAFSLSLDTGKRFDLSNNFYIEPALKLAYLHNGGNSFDTKGASTINVKKTSTDIFQYGAGLNIGKTVPTAATGSFVQPYLSITALKQEVSGGDIKSGDAKIKNKLDGYQVQSNLGINWQINKNNGVFTEVNASTGDKYNNAFGIAAGYRYSF